MLMKTCSCGSVSPRSSGPIGPVADWTVVSATSVEPLVRGGEGRPRLGAVAGDEPGALLLGERHEAVVRGPPQRVVGRIGRVTDPPGLSDSPREGGRRRRPQPTPPP